MYHQNLIYIFKNLKQLHRTYKTNPKKEQPMRPSFQIQRCTKATRFKKRVSLHFSVTLLPFRTDLFVGQIEQIWPLAMVVVYPGICSKRGCEVGQRVCLFFVYSRLICAEGKINYEGVMAVMWNRVEGLPLVCDTGGGLRFWKQACACSEENPKWAPLVGITRIRINVPLGTATLFQKSWMPKKKCPTTVRKGTIVLFDIFTFLITWSWMRIAFFCASKVDDLWNKRISLFESTRGKTAL